MLIQDQIPAFAGMTVPLIVILRVFPKNLGRILEWDPSDFVLRMTGKEEAGMTGREGAFYSLKISSLNLAA